MKASENETVDDVIAEWRLDVESWNWISSKDVATARIDRIEVAYKRDVEKLNKRLEFVIDDSNRTCGLCESSKKILELSECLKEAISTVRIDCSICKRDCKMKMSFADSTSHNCERIIKWRKALEGATNAN